MAEGEAKDSKKVPSAVSLKRDDATGEIRTANNKRAVVMTGDLWKALTASLSERLADQFDEVLYSAGLSWGAEAFTEFDERVSAAHTTPYHRLNMPLDEFKQEFNNYLLRHGWGRFDIYQKSDHHFIDLFSSAYSEMLGGRGTMGCSLMAGFFSGFFSGLIGVDLDCIELQCASAGAKKCTFVLADSAVIGSVRKWLSKGRSFEEIVAAIGAKEYQGKK